MEAAVTLFFQTVPIYHSQPTVIYLTLITKTIYIQQQILINITPNLPNSISYFLNGIYFFLELKL